MFDFFIPTLTITHEEHRMNAWNHFHFGTLIAAVLVAVAPQAMAQNMLENPNFEDGPPGQGATGWESFDNVFTEAENGGDVVPCEGSQVLKMFSNFSGGFSVSGAYQEFPTTPGTEWSLQCTAYHSSLDPLSGIGEPNDTWVTQKIAWFDAGGAEIGAEESTILDGTYTTDVCHRSDKISGVAPAGTVAVRPYLLFLSPPPNDPGAAQLDEVVFLNETTGVQSMSWSAIKAMRAR